MVEEWLVEQDNEPRIFPRWPHSRRQALVALLVEDMGTKLETDAAAFVLTKRAEADKLVDFKNGLDSAVVIFFTVSKQKVINLIPELAQATWDTN